MPHDSGEGSRHPWVSKGRGPADPRSATIGIGT